MHDHDHSSRSFLNIACYEGQTALVQILLEFNVDMRQELELISGNVEIINILNLKLKKSIKHRGKIKKLKALDEKMLTKVMFFEMFTVLLRSNLKKNAFRTRSRTRSRRVP